MGPHSSRTLNIWSGYVCTAPTSRVKLHNWGIQIRGTHDERTTTTAAQQQQHISAGDVGGPEETPVVAPATSPIVVGITKSHGRPPHGGVASVQRKVDGWQGWHIDTKLQHADCPPLFQTSAVTSNKHEQIMKGPPPVVEALSTSG